MFETYEKIKELTKNRGMSMADLEEKLGFGKNTSYSWKKKMPGMDKLEAIADFFGVSIDYLVGRTDNPYVVRIGQDALEMHRQYTDQDLEDILDHAVTFQGQPISDEERALYKRVLLSIRGDG